MNDETNEYKPDSRLQSSARLKRIPDYFTPDEIYRIMETASGLGPAYSLLIQLPIKTGVRIWGELQNIDLSDIDKEKHQLVVRGVCGNIRYIPISADLIESIFLYTAPRTSGYIFVYPKTGKQLPAGRLNQMIRRISLKSGIVVKPQRLRKTYAHILISKGVKNEDIGLFMGWSEEMVSKLYFDFKFVQEQKEKYLELVP